MKFFWTNRPTVTRISLPIQAVIFLACALAVCLRVPDRIFNPQFWAEDGTIFFIQAVTGGVRSLWTPYAGALYTYQRIPALIAAQFQWQYSPTVYAGFNWLALVIAVFWCTSSRLPFSMLTRCLLALCMTFASVKNEVYLNLANATWIFSGCGMLLLAMSNSPINRAQKFFDYSACLIMGLSGPFSILYFPLFALRAAFERKKHGFILLALTSSCGLTQLMMLPSRSYELMGGVLNASLAQYISVFDFRFLWMVTGYSAFPFFTLPAYIGIFAFIVIAGTAALLTLECYRAHGLVGVFPLLGGSAVISSVFIQYEEMPEALINASRYFYIPIVTFLWAAAIASERRPWVFLPIIAASFLAFLSHPQWDEYAMPDLNWKGYAVCLRDNPDCVAPVHPLGFGLTIFSPRAEALISDTEIASRMKSNMGRVTKLPYSKL